LEEIAMNRLNPLNFAVATTVTLLLLYVVCAVAVVLFPDGTVSFFNSWFHGLDLNLLKPPGGRPLTLQQFVMGALAVIAVAFPAGLVLAAVYDFLLNRGSRAA
jgi:hypothetical protein